MRRNATRGFTIIELLVVVAVIALLIAMLLPALGRARTSAKTAACAANMHGIGLAIALYTTDHREYPTNSLSTAGSLTPGLLAPYTPPAGDKGISSIYLCPEESNHGSSGDVGFVTRQNLPSPGPWPSLDPLNCTTVIAEAGSPARIMNDPTIRRSPASIMLAGDARTISTRRGTHYVKAWYTASYVDTPDLFSGPTLFPRHGGAIMLLYGDAHVESMAWKEFTAKRGTSAGPVFNFLLLMDPREAN